MKKVEGHPGYPVFSIPDPSDKIDYKKGENLNRHSELEPISKPPDYLVN